MDEKNAKRKGVGKRMIFRNALIEYAYQVPLKTWNAKQKNLWYDLVNRGDFKRNDASAFMKFAKAFNKLYEKNHKFPSMKDIIKAMEETK